jgi:hypothetical protein
MLARRSVAMPISALTKIPRRICEVGHTSRGVSGDTLRKQEDRGSVAMSASAIAMLILYVIITFAVSGVAALATALALSALHII